MSWTVKLPPEAERRAALEALIAKGLEPSPENLIEASRKPGAPLHDYFASIPEAKWAEVGRYECARRIIRTTKVEFAIGGKTITTRMVEFVRVDGEKRYAAMREILRDQSMLDAYKLEIQSLLKHASDKLDRLWALMKD